MVDEPARILLSPPRLGSGDREAVVAALESGWIAPAGPHLSDFEDAMGAYLGMPHAVALSSGTAALHLALKYVGVREHDVVLVPTVTFAATAFAVTYLGAVPVFIDVDEGSWGMDPNVVEEALVSMARRGKRVSAAVPVDLYGSPANYSALLPLFADHNVAVVEDAAEGLGATHGERKLGGFGQAGVLSFNGNKLITTSGGGMLVTKDAAMATRIRKWSTQSREDTPWYEHTEIGYNYRMSNVLAALGHSQLKRVDSEVTSRRRIRDAYRERLVGIEGVFIQSDPPWGRSNAWLTIIQLNRSFHPDASRHLRDALAAEEIESRPIWKPMHQQPVFRENEAFLAGRADALFEEGLCLPSGTALTEKDIDRVCSVIIKTLTA